MSVSLKDISTRFDSARRELGYNFSQLAKILNTTHVNLSKIASGKATPNLQIIANMIDKLQVSPAYLFYGIGPIQNEEWNMLLDAGQIENKVLSKLQNLKENQFYKTIFSALSSSISIQVFLCLFFKKIDGIDIQPEGAKEKLLDLLKNFEKEYKNFQLLPSNARYLSEKDRQKAINFITKNFDDVEAYFMLKNAKKIKAEIKKEIPHINKIFNC